MQCCGNGKYHQRRAKSRKVRVRLLAHLVVRKWSSRWAVQVRWSWEGWWRLLLLTVIDAVSPWKHQQWSDRRRRRWRRRYALYSRTPSLKSQKSQVSTCFRHRPSSRLSSPQVTLEIAKSFPELTCTDFLLASLRGLSSFLTACQHMRPAIVCRKVSYKLITQNSTFTWLILASSVSSIDPGNSPAIETSIPLFTREFRPNVFNSWGNLYNLLKFSIGCPAESSYVCREITWFFQLKIVEKRRKGGACH